MSSLASILVGLALAGAFASWIIGAVYYARTLRSISADSQMLWLAVIAWPFAVARIKGAAATEAARVNKALVSFMACVVIAVAAFSVAANLQRFAR